MTSYLFATNRPWNLEAFMLNRSRMPGTWHICVNPSDLASMVELLGLRYVFFPHWSHIVPEAVLQSCECVCFHMTDVPYGRGGSPLQNLISRGHQTTKLTALRMTNQIDAGPVYMKRDLDLFGTAEEIYRRAAETMMLMIESIVLNEPTPVPQSGEPVFFKRRTPNQSRMPNEGNLLDLFDHVRMLDAPGYPHAFFETAGWRATITGARLEADSIEARVRIVLNNCVDKI